MPNPHGFSRGPAAVTPRPDEETDTAQHLAAPPTPTTATTTAATATATATATTALSDPATDPVSMFRTILDGPSGLGTSAVRAFWTATDATITARHAAAQPTATDQPTADPAPTPPSPSPAAPSTSTSTSSPSSASSSSSSEVQVPPLYGPDALRDDPALGDAVDDRLVAWWGGEIGARPGELEKLRACGFGRLIMLAHPDCDDVDRLAAAAKCAVAEWAVDDLYLDGDSAESAPERIPPRLAMAYAAMAPARVPPPPYSIQYDEQARQDPVQRAIRSSWTNLGRYASPTQVFRLRHELAVMFVAYNQEAEWHISGRVPPVWEFLMHRWENAFCPCMVLTDVVGGYEVPPHEYFDPRVRRVFTTAGVASVLVNDLYSLRKEEEVNAGFDFSLPTVLMAEEGCTLQEAVDRTAALHDDLVHYIEAESAALTAQGSPLLGRFLAGVWAWMGGGRRWHATSARYHAAPADSGAAAGPDTGAPATD